MSWWDDAPDDELAGAIDRIDARWRDGALPGLRWVGSTDGRERGERVLVVGIDAARDPRPRAWAPKPGLRDTWARRLIRRYGPLAHPPPDSQGGLLRVGLALLRARQLRTAHSVLDVVLVPVYEADWETIDELRDCDAPASTLIIYLGSSVPAGRTHGLGIVEADNLPGSLGLMLVVENGGFVACTAGHCAHNVGAPMFVSKRLRLGRRRWRKIGTVVRRTSPGRTDVRATVPEGADVALVEVESAGVLPLLSKVMATMTMTSLHRGDDLRWRGDASGSVNGLFVARTEEAAITSSKDYKSCLAFGVRHGAARQGDSGAPVLGRGGIVGYVTRVFGTNEAGLYQGCVIQAIDVAIDYASLDYSVRQVRTFDGW